MPAGLTGVLDQGVSRRVFTILIGGLLALLIVTKPETDFGDDDRAMARRAAWLLNGHAPARELPPPDLEVGGFGRFVGEHGGLTPLAHFGTIRLEDAIRGQAAPPCTTPKDVVEPPTSEPLRRNQMRAEACRREKRAIEQLREGELRIANALGDWLAASEARADDYAGPPAQFLTGAHHAVLGELLSVSEQLGKIREFLENALRYVALEENGDADPFPSLYGLPKAARNVALDDQALCLRHAGHTLEQVAYVMGWYYGDVEQIKKRTAKRLKEAEERRREKSEPCMASDMAWNFSGFP